MKKTINVTIWNEYVHEKTNENIAKVYPNGIHDAIKEKLSQFGDFNITIATLDMEEHGLTDEVLDNTDVLIWWGHCKHGDVSDEIALKVKEKVLGGMGFIALHSAHASKPFKLLMGTSCRVKWRENDEKERLWVVEPSHPIAQNVPEYIEFPQEETYGECFDIPVPDQLIFLSWFAGGEIFRSGCCYNRGLGKVFYFRPGHEEYPTFYRDDVTQVIANAVRWACPYGITKPTMGKFMPLENLE